MIGIQLFKIKVINPKLNIINDLKYILIELHK